MEAVRDYTHKQVRKLTDDQKVELVIQKELRPTPTSTNNNIASHFGVSPGLVAHTNVDTLTPKQRALYEQRKRELSYHALKLTDNAIKKANDLVNEATSANQLSGVVAALGKAHDIYRLETNQSTANIAVLDVASLINKTLEIAVKLHKADHTEPLPTRQEIADNYAQLCAKNGVQPDESLIDFSVLDAIEPPQS
jgi:hypothetical protein